MRKAATAFSASQPSQFCLSITRVDQSKTVQDRINKSSLGLQDLAWLNNTSWHTGCAPLV